MELFFDLLILIIQPIKEYPVLTGIIIGLIIGIPLLVKSFRKTIVTGSSLKYNGIENLNDKYHFYSIPEYPLSKECSSKAQFDRFDADAFVTAAIIEDESWLVDLCSQVMYNRKLYESYIDEYNRFLSGKNYKYDVPESVFDKVLTREKFSKKSWYIKREQEKLDTLKLKPDTDLDIKLYLSYTSPMGQNYYEDVISYDYEHAQQLLDMAKAQQKYRQTKQYQRSLMSDSLRYDVMKRDNFTCQLCGATARDGAKLHVDHIIPVARGGKTTMSNLRTLCDSCNRGKRDKYDPEGVN